MEIETAARKQLLGKSSVTNLVGGRVWKFKLEEPLEGTGNCAVVVRRGGGWVKPGKNSQEYPILVVECFADHSRDSAGNPVKDDRDERVMQLVREVDRVLHQVDREHRYWPEGDESGLYVIGCFRSAEPEGPVEKHGVAAARVVYDVQVFH